MSANPHLNIINDWETMVYDIVRKEAQKRPIKVLDVGGEIHKPFGKGISSIRNVNYQSLNIKGELRSSIEGDICEYNTHIDDNSFDFVISKDVFEHILEPWSAAVEMNRIANNGGYIIVIVPFAWRYHPVPYDTFRYSHTALRYLFEHKGGVKHIKSGYKKENDGPGFWKDKLDYTLDTCNSPFKENIHTIYMGQKIEGHIFDKNSLDSR